MPKGDPHRAGRVRRGLALGAVLLLSVWAARTGQAQCLTAAEAALARADTLTARGATADVRAAYRTAAERDARCRPAYLALARLAAEAGDWPALADAADALLAADRADTAGRYYRALAHRELGRFRTPLDRVKELLHWRKAEEHFEWLLARDSSYRDVLYQYALLEQYRGHYEDALGHVHAQLRQVPPEDEVRAEVLTGLLHLYHQFLLHDPAGAVGWAEGRGDAHGTYVLAERDRRAGRYEAAERGLIALLEQPGAFPEVPVRMAMARLYHVLGHPAVAEAQYWYAVEAVRTPADAALLFDDLKLILTPAELTAYQTADGLEAYGRFFRDVWRRRDPLPASRTNPRLAEHIGRLVYAEATFAHDGPRLWWRDPDPLNQLDFGPVYALNETFNDKGYVYLRYGAPTERVVTLDAGVEPNESWRYAETEEQPAQIFHFATKGGADWRLVPALMGLAVAADRTDWGEPYTTLFRLGTDDPSRLRLEAPALRDVQRTRSQEAVDVLAVSGRHTWPDEVEPLPVPFVSAAFRGADGQTELEVYYAFPLDPIAAAREADRVRVEVGLAVHDTAWARAAHALDVKALALSQGVAGDGVIDRFRVQAPPDSYHVALHVRPDGTPLVGAHRFDLRLPDFSAPVLAVSGIVPAYAIQPAQDGAPFARHGLNVVANPTARFPRARPIHVYFEVYNLTFGPDDLTDYDVAYTLEAIDPPRRGLFRRRDPVALRIEARHQGDAATSVEFAEIDAGRVDPGPYRLTVTITDRLTGASAERTIPITLQ